MTIKKIFSGYAAIAMGFKPIAIMGKPVTYKSDFAGRFRKKREIKATSDFQSPVSYPISHISHLQ